MLRQTRWSPDTCNCVLDYQWDDSVPESARTYTLKNIEKRCPEHNAVNNDQLYDAVLSENQGKNAAFGEIERLLAPPNQDADAREALQRKISRSFDWRFDDQRKLVVNYPEITDGQLMQLQQALDARLGSGKVSCSNTRR